VQDPLEDALSTSYGLEVMPEIADDAPAPRPSDSRPYGLALHLLSSVYARSVCLHVPIGVCVNMPSLVGHVSAEGLLSFEFGCHSKPCQVLPNS
jgi:hypothetical protein